MKQPKKSNIETIKKFIKHLWNSSDKALDMYHDDIDYDENDFNIKISCNGMEIQIDLNADFLVNLEHILLEEVEYMENNKIGGF